MKLIIEDDEGHKTTVPFVREEITVGREDGNTIRLTERNVSRKHARFYRQSGAVYVEDLKSYNGIKVNGDKIDGAIALKEGDLVQIGDYDLAVQEEVAAAPPATPINGRPTLKMEAIDELITAAESTTRNGGVERDPSKPAAPARGREATALIRMNGGAAAPAPGAAPEGHDISPDEAPRLVVISTELAGREFSLIRSVITIGRGAECDVALDHRSLSRAHARVYRDDDGNWKVTDLGSSNHVQVNGEEYAEANLKSADVISLGHVKLRFVAPGEEYTFRADRPDGKRKLNPVILGVGGAVLLGAVSTGVYFGFFHKSSQPNDSLDNPHDHEVAINTPPKSTGGTAPDNEVKNPPTSATGDKNNVVANANPKEEHTTSGKPPVAPTAATAPSAPSAATNAIATNPKNPPDDEVKLPDNTKQQQQAQALLKKGQGELAQGKLDAAQADLKRAQEMGADASGPLAKLSTEQSALAQFENAEHSVASNDLDGAVASLDSIPKDSQVYSKAAKLRATVDAKIKAAAKKNNTAAVKADHPKGTTGGDSQLNTGSEPEKEALGLRTDAEAAINRGDYDTAVGKLRKSLKLNPKDAQAHFLIAQCLAQNNELEDAAEHFRKFLDLAPNDPKAARVKEVLKAYEDSRKSGQ